MPESLPVQLRSHAQHARRPLESSRYTQARLSYPALSAGGKHGYSHNHRGGGHGLKRETPSNNARRQRDNARSEERDDGMTTI